MTDLEKKEAKRLYDIEYRKKNREKLIIQASNRYHNLSPEEKLAYNKQKYAKLDKEKKANEDKEYAKNNKEKLNAKKRAWAKANKEKVKKAKYDYVVKKLKSDPLYRFKHNTTCSIRNSLVKNGYTKKARAYQILGCSFDEFKIHIESKFESWMTWDNYGNLNNHSLQPNQTWDIDHIIPLNSAKSEDEVIKLNHYLNLQPLCSYVNRHIKKGIIDFVQ